MSASSSITSTTSTSHVFTKQGSVDWLRSYFGGGKTVQKPASSTITSTTSGFSNVFLQENKHAALIGPKGTILQGLRDKHRVSIEIPKKGSGSTKITVSGQVDHRQNCIKEMGLILGHPVQAETPLVTTKVSIPVSSHARLIGKAGATVRYLQREGCAIETPAKDSGSTEITLIGYPSVVEQAMSECRDLVGPSNFKVVSSESNADIETEFEFVPLSLDGKIVEALFFPETTAGDTDGVNFRRFLHYLVSARNSLEVCVFTITDDRISHALIAAHHRGVRVRIITDDDQAKALGSDIDEMMHQGIEVRQDRSKFHMHHKFAIVDRKVLLNGSYNWTRNANLCNNENITILSEPSLIKAFSEEFERLWAQFK